jgi:hypothetical protein
MSMMKTSDSHPRHNPDDHPKMIKVQESDPVSVSTMNEIDLYLKGYEQWEDWWDLMYQNTPDGECSHEQNILFPLFAKLPSEYELLLVRRDEMWNVTGRFYMHEYTIASSSDKDTCSRSVILINVRALLDFMRIWKEQLKEELSEEHWSKYEMLYESTVSKFHDWMDVAAPRVKPLSTLRDREQSGRVTHRSRRLLTLLAHLNDF